MGIFLNNFVAMRNYSVLCTGVGLNLSRIGDEIYIIVFREAMIFVRNKIRKNTHKIRNARFCTENEYMGFFFYHNFVCGRMAKHYSQGPPMADAGLDWSQIGDEIYINVFCLVMTCARNKIRKTYKIRNTRFCAGYEYLRENYFSS